MEPRLLKLKVVTAELDFLNQYWEILIHVGLGNRLEIP